ncbi:MAG: DUF4416 family protein [bacterium]
MMPDNEPPPGRLVVSTITSSWDALAEAVEHLERRFGRAIYETDQISCCHGERYLEEMGERVWRRLFSFERPVLRSSLPELKAACARIEPRFSDRLGDFCFRTVNIDPGILTSDNLVMASRHNANHRIYISGGTYAEVTLIYSRDRFTRLPWTDPDFCHPEVIDFLDRVRGSFDLVTPT